MPRPRSPRRRNRISGLLSPAPWVYQLPATNAILNAASAVFLLTGFAMIRSGKVFAHRICMLTAFACSSLFLVGYVYYHSVIGVIRFQRPGLDSSRLFHDPHHAHDPRGDDCPARAHHAHARAAQPVPSSPRHRPLDAAALALRFRHRRNYLLDALPPLPADYARNTCARARRLASSSRLISPRQ